MSSHPERVHFAYWGRRGGGARMTLELTGDAIRHPGLTATVSISRNNELLASYAPLGAAVELLDTFESNVGALSKSWRLPAVKWQLLERLRRDRTQAFVTLMPHVWSPLIAPAIRRAGIPYATIVHDGVAHPGDNTGLVHGWLLRDARQADLVIALSEAVARHLHDSGAIKGKRLVTLFTPDMGPREGQPVRVPLPFPEAGQPFRVAFVGRIMPYKGLPLLIEAVRLARGRGVPIQLGVFGAGDLGAAQEGLLQLGAEVDNRWLSEAELAAALARQHAVVLSHVEASQSGVAALASGHGVPVIATPVGGLVEQVAEDRNGVLAEAATAEALADAITRLATDAGLYRRLCTAIRDTRSERSFDRFLAELLPVLPCSQA